MAPIIGLCRFSFLGRGDWRAWRGDRGPVEEAWRQDLAARLYHPDRMEERFWTLENLLLPSLRAQTEQGFHLVILTSYAMPLTYRIRLKQLVAAVPQIHLEVSGADNVNDGLFPALDYLRKGAEATVQFRIDDDDCLAIDYVERLAEFSRRMQGFGPFAYSRPAGLLVTAYRGHGIRYFRQEQPFHSVGTALYVTDPRKTIFSLGHFTLQMRFSSFLDRQAPAFLALKWDGHDSFPLDTAHLPRGFSEIEAEQFATATKVAFPFLRPRELVAWLRRGEAEEERTSAI